MSNALKDAMNRVDASSADNPNNYELDNNALRAIAHNAVYEAMLMRGRTRFSPRDAQRADLIFRALADTPASQLDDLERTAVIPPVGAGNTALLSSMAKAVSSLDEGPTGQTNDGGSTGQAA